MCHVSEFIIYDGWCSFLSTAHWGTRRNWKGKWRELFAWLDTQEPWTQRLSLPLFHITSRSNNNCYFCLWMAFIHLMNMQWITGNLLYHYVNLVNAALFKTRTSHIHTCNITPDDTISCQRHTLSVLDLMYRKMMMRIWFLLHCHLQQNRLMVIKNGLQKWNN